MLRNDKEKEFIGAGMEIVSFCGAFMAGFSMGDVARCLDGLLVSGVQVKSSSQLQGQMALSNLSLLLH